MERGRRSKAAKARNQQLYDLLVSLRENPDDAGVQEGWILAAQDLAIAVFNTQFASLRDSPDRDDLIQVALMEFHRVSPKLAGLTTTFHADNLFRILYSVAKFSMLRELSKLRKHSHEDRLDRVRVDLDVILLEGSPDHPIQEPTQELEEESRDRYVAVHLPLELVREIDRRNLYAGTPWREPVRFTALQRLRGKYVSIAFIQSMWGPPSPELVVSYADFLARTVVLYFSSREAVRRQVAV